MRLRFRTLARRSKPGKPAIKESVQDEIPVYPVSDAANSAPETGPNGTSYSRTVARFKQEFKESDDFSIREVKVGDSPCIHIAIFYIQGISDQDSQSGFVLESTMLLGKLGEPAPKAGHPGAFDTVQGRLLAYAALRLTSEFDEAFGAILSGDTVVIVDNDTRMMILDTKGWAQRGVEEPATEAVIRGPRDGFVETMRVNVAHIRRRLKTTKMAVKETEVGKRTKTSVSLVYMTDLADEHIVDRLHRKLKNPDIDGITSSGQLELILSPRPLSLFPLIERTERPDKVAASILEGRIAIVVDNSPFVLLVPTSIWGFFQASEDYYESPLLGSFLRLLRLVSALISTLGTAFYVAIVLFHQEVIPFTLMLRIVSTHEGLPLGTLPTALLMEISIEILREAGVRLPRPVGSAISIVGAIIIGEAAVNAGFVPPGMVIVVALATIAGFAIPAYNMAIGLRLARFFTIILGGTLGLYGLGIATMTLLSHVAGICTFDYAYADPLGTDRIHELQDGPIVIPERATDGRRPAWSDGVRHGPQLTKEHPQRGSGKGSTNG